LAAAWQELASDTATAEFVNGIIDAVRAIVELVDKVGIANLAVDGITSSWQNKRSW